MRIPYISGLRKYAIQDFKPEEIKRTEEIMLEILDWNLQFATLIDLVEYFLCQGVVFSADQVSLAAEGFEIKEIGAVARAQKQEPLGEKSQRFVSRLEKSKSVMEGKESSSNKSFIGFETEGKKEEKYRFVREMGEKQIEDLVNKVEKEARRLSNILIKGMIWG